MAYRRGSYTGLPLLRTPFHEEVVSVRANYVDETAAQVAFLVQNTDSFNPCVTTPTPKGHPSPVRGQSGGFFLVFFGDLLAVLGMG